VLVLDVKGVLKTHQLTEKELLQTKGAELHLHLRDLRRLYIDNPYSAEVRKKEKERERRKEKENLTLHILLLLLHQPSILVASNCFLVRIEFLKALVEPHQVIFFAADNPLVEKFAKQL
jgi:hypothetical protein